MDNPRNIAPTMPISEVQEPSTGIRFPRYLNGFILLGCGVRVKFGFVKGYAVGTYVDMATKEAFNTATYEILLNPDYARIVRIVMNRSAPIDMFNASITEVLTPRMNGRDLDQLNKFKELGPRHDLSVGDIIELSIRGDTMEYKNSLGGVGQIKSIIFTQAICNAFYGEDCVSPSHKEAVIKGISSIS